MKPLKPRLSRHDRQIQLLSRGLVEQIIGTRGTEDETNVVAQYKGIQLQVSIGNGVIDIMAFFIETKEVYAWTQYNKGKRQIGFNIRQQVLQRSLNDLILFERMTGGKIN
jgi:hypothetical protein